MLGCTWHGPECAHHALMHVCGAGRRRGVFIQMSYIVGASNHSEMAFFGHLKELGHCLPVAFLHPSAFCQRAKSCTAKHFCCVCVQMGCQCCGPHHVVIILSSTTQVHSSLDCPHTLYQGPNLGTILYFHLRPWLETKKKKKPNRLTLFFLVLQPKYMSFN